jgi:hypothetical protein
MTEDRLTDSPAPACRSELLIRCMQNRTGLLYVGLPCVVALVVGAFLAACSQTVNELTFFTDPGKYEWHSCEQLLPQRKYCKRCFSPILHERHSSEDANLLMASVRIYGRPYS